MNTNRLEKSTEIEVDAENEMNAQVEELYLLKQIIRSSRILKVAIKVFNTKKYLCDQIQILFSKNVNQYRFDITQNHIDLPIKSPIKPFKVAIHFHVYFTNHLPLFVNYLNNIPFSYTCFVTTDNLEKKDKIEEYFEQNLKENSCSIIITPNKGRDLIPWIVEMGKVNDEFDYCCHIHTKESRHLPLMGSVWREYLLDNLLGSAEHVNSIIAYFEAKPDLGIVYPPVFKGVSNKDNLGWGAKISEIKRLFQQWGLDEPPVSPEFSAGTMMWYRSEAFSKLFQQNFSYEKFNEEALNGTFLHILERSIVDFSKKNGYHSEKIINSDEFKKALPESMFGYFPKT